MIDVDENENEIEVGTPADAPDGAAEGEPDDVLGLGGTRALKAERKARRDAERRVTALARRVEAVQRERVEEIAGRPADGFRPLAEAADLWKLDGVEFGAMLDAEGNVDPDRVRAMVGDVLERRPHWGAPTPRFVGSADGGKGVASPGPDPAALAAQIMADQ